MPQLDITSFFNQAVYIYVYFFLSYFIVLVFVIFTVKRSITLKKVLFKFMENVKKSTFIRVTDNFSLFLNKQAIYILFSKKKALVKFIYSIKNVKSSFLSILLKKEV